MPVLALNTPPPLKSEEIISVHALNSNTRASIIDLSKPEHVEPQEDTATSKFPIAKIDTEAITNSLAARLASTLLGHVLYLKNQVPFPVLQLGRLPPGKSSARAIKQRMEMLASFDTICSHLDTTFSALSTAMAKGPPSSNEDTAQVFMAILVGPSLTTAKSRVILGIDGLEKRIWGIRADLPTQSEDESEDEEDHSDTNESDNESEGHEQPEDSSSENEEEEDTEEEEEEEDGEVDEGADEETTDDPEEEEGDGDRKEKTNAPIPVSICPAADYVSPAEQEKLLKSADRLLSRTMAAADATGHGFISEISPTQTHVLLRAPRRFNHPAWIPRQNVTLSLDSSLANFVASSAPQDGVDERKPVRKQNNKIKTEGIWITTRHGIRPSEQQEVHSTASSQEELDDMIWWSWDGKFVGFADW